MPTISDLIDVFWESQKRSARELPVSRITVHHVAGRGTVESILSEFLTTPYDKSTNYCIGIDGRIGCCVPEEYRAWTSGNWDNDQGNFDWHLTAGVNRLDGDQALAFSRIRALDSIGMRWD